MACNCHGDRKGYEENVRAYDQCLYCAKKHVVQAWQQWHEYEHELDNRDACSAELRACASHCKYIQPEIAKKARALALRIESVDDGGIPTIATEVQALKDDVNKALMDADKGILERLNSFRESK